MGSKIKKLLSLLMVVCMVASMLPTTVFATTGERVLTPEQQAYYDTYYETYCSGYTKVTVKNQAQWKDLRGGKTYGVATDAENVNVYVDVQNDIHVGSTSQAQAGTSSTKKTNVVINLNRHTITREVATRMFAVYAGMALGMVYSLGEQRAVLVDRCHHFL